MPERKTLLFRPSGAPVAQPAQTGAPGGAFGDFRGMAAAGQALGDVANAGFAYAKGQKNDAARLREEMDNRTMRDYQLKHQNALDLAVLGVRKEYEQKLSAGEFMDGGSFNWLESRLSEAKTQAGESLSQYTQDPLYKKAVSHDLTEHLWTQRTDNLLTNAAGQEGVAKQQGRLDDLGTMVGAAFGGIEPGRHDLIATELEEKSNIIENMPVSPGAKKAFRRDLADRAFDTVMRGLDRGVRVPPYVINDPNFSPGQKRMIEVLDAKVGKPKDFFANTAEANDVLQKSLGLPDLAADPIALQTARYAADHIAAHVESPEAKRYAHAAIDLKLAEQAITKNNFASIASLGGQKLYQRLSNLSTTLADPKQADAFYESFGIKGADPKERSRFLEKIRSVADAKLDLINNGKANFVADQSDALSPIAAAAGAEFTSDKGITRETAQRYVRASMEEQTFMGIPEHLQVHVPAKVVDTMVNSLWNHDSNNGSRMLLSVGGNFGAQALDSLTRSFLAPTATGNDKATGSTSPRNRSLAALVKLVSADHSRVEGGAGRLELTDSLKQWIDDLGNYEKNSSTFPRGSELKAQQAFDQSYYNNPVSSRELLNAEQFGRVTSQIQSLPWIARGLAWHSGQNNDLSSGFQELMVRIIQSQSSSAGVSAGDDKFSREHLMSQAVDKLNNTVARVFTVVPVAGVESGMKIVDVWPTKLVKEGALSLPIQYGAADAVDLSDHMANVLEYVGYYDPRRNWERSVLADAITRTTNSNFRDNPLFHSFLSKGSITPLPPHLQVDWARVDGITPGQYGSGGEKLLKDYLENPKTRYTINSVAFKDSGAWRYNWKTQEVEAMIFPGRSSSPSSPSVRNPGPAQPLMYNYGDGAVKLLRPVSIKAEDIRTFDYIYRTGRVIGDQRRTTESQFVTPPIGP